MAFLFPLVAPLFEGMAADVATTAATSVARSVLTNGIESVAKGATRKVVTKAGQGAAKREVKSVAKKATSSIQNNAMDKAFREKWAPSQLNVVGPQHPGKNIMIVCTKHDASKLQGVDHSVLACEYPASKTTVNYDCYVFDSGEFELQGDGGFENWAFSGKFVRKGKKLTFSKA